MSRTKTYDGAKLSLKAELIDWWCERVAQRISAHEVRGVREELHSIKVRKDTIYSYGDHFPMGEIHRTPGGRARMVVLNGDSWGGPSGWGNGTAGDQASVRRGVRAVIERESLDIPVIVVPFSAMEAAGIDRASLTPVQIRDDWTTTTEETSAERPGKLAQVETGETEEYETTAWSWFDADGNEVKYDAEVALHQLGTVTRERKVMVDDPNRAHVDKRYAHGWVDGYAELQSDGTWKWEIRRHWLGDSLFRARTVEQRRRFATNAERETFEAHEAWEREERRLREQHRDAHSSWAYANHAVKAGDPTRHQMRLVKDGPMVVPTSEDVSRLEFERDHTNALHENHLVSEPVRQDELDIRRAGERVFVSYSVRRWAYYLSSFDYNEPHNPYFLCELPRTVHRDGQVYRPKPETVDEAIDWLRPNAVVQAERAGLNVLRQGDVFAIPTAYTTAELEFHAKPHERRVYDDKCSVCGQAGYTIVHNRETEEGHHHHAPVGWTTKTVLQRSKVTDGTAAEVLGTNHAPTRAILAEDGDWYGKGRLYHTPAGRDPDHRVLELGDRETWYRLVKNTVPMSGGARTRFTQGGGGRVFQTQSRAWMLGGGVD